MVTMLLSRLDRAPRLRSSRVRGTAAWPRTGRGSGGWCTLPGGRGASTPGPPAGGGYILYIYNIYIYMAARLMLLDLITWADTANTSWPVIGAPSQTSRPSPVIHT